MSDNERNASFEISDSSSGSTTGELGENLARQQTILRRLHAANFQQRSRFKSKEGKRFGTRSPHRNTKKIQMFAWKDFCLLGRGTNEDVELVEDKCGPGFANLGNGCYLNASLQCLIHCEAFVSEIRVFCLKVLEGRKHHGFCALNEFFKLTNEYFRADAPVVLYPKAFYDNISSISSQLAPGEQEDAHEFIHSILSKIDYEESYGCSNDQSSGYPFSNRGLILENSFQGTTVTSIKCFACNKISKQSYPFISLTLQTASASSVAAGLEYLMRPVILESETSYNCSSCRRPTRAIMHTAIEKSPEIMMLHMNRFDNGGKLDNFIAYSSVLSIGRYLEFPGGSVEYELISVLVHHGEMMTSGHYTADVKSGDGNWCRKDDINCYKITAAEALLQKAYLLFYKKRLQGHCLGEKRFSSSNADNEAIPIVDGDMNESPWFAASKSYRAS